MGFISVYESMLNWSSQTAIGIYFSVIWCGNSLGESF